MLKHKTARFLMTMHSALGCKKTNTTNISLFLQKNSMQLFKNPMNGVIAEYSKSSIKKKSLKDTPPSHHHHEKKASISENLACSNENAELLKNLTINSHPDGDFNTYEQEAIVSEQHHDIKYTKEEETGTLQAPPGLYVVATPIGNMHDLSGKNFYDSIE